MKRRWISVLLLVVCAAVFLYPVTAAAEGGIPVGGINILMSGVSGEVLEGAEFRILRDSRDPELGDHRVEKKMVKIHDEHRIMTVESFWTTKDMTGEKIHSVITDQQGRASVYGLSYGTYYLLETKAPEGYNRITEPIRVTVHKYSHLSREDQVVDDEGKLIDNTLHIINVRYTLPDTARWGVVQLAAAGTGLLFSSAALLLLMRKRK